MPKLQSIPPSWIREFSPELHDELLTQYPPDQRPLPQRIPAGNAATREGMERRHACLRAQGITVDQILPSESFDPATIQGNIENFVGFTQVPIGVIGPLRINGLHANGDFYVPLATTEGAMVASFHRGATAISQSGGVTTICVADTIIRAPAFVFTTMLESIHFIKWIHTQTHLFDELVARRTSHGKLTRMKVVPVGSIVYLLFYYETGEASGQNMVTVATEEICNFIVEASPIKIAHWYLEGNFSGDKKANMISMMGNRGKKVIAECTLPRRVVQMYLKCTPEQMLEYGRVSRIGAVHSGSIGMHGHFANGLCGIFLACGQDVACVAEATVGNTDFYILPNGDMQANVTLPNLTVGTVGGGTHLPTARECLNMLGCQGVDSARKFAEICAAVVLSGELSIIAALSVGHFGRAHANYRHKTADTNAPKTEDTPPPPQEN